MSEEKKDWSEGVPFTGGKKAAYSKPVSPDNVTNESPRWSGHRAKQLEGVARTALVLPHTLTFALLPSPVSNFPLSSLAAWPPNGLPGSASPRSLGLSCQLSCSRLASVRVSGGGSGGSRALRVSEAEGALRG